MKILRNRYDDEMFPVKVQCPSCGSILEVERDDCNIGTLGFYIAECPVCEDVVKLEEGYEKLNNKIADKYFENLSVDTIKYPDTFYEHNKGKNVNNITINDWLSKIVSELENGSNFSIISSGNTIVFGLKTNNGFEYDDDEFYVLKDAKVSFDKNGNMTIVSKNFGDCTIYGGDD